MLSAFKTCSILFSGKFNSTDICTTALLENLTDDALAQLYMCRNCRSFPSFFTKLYVTYRALQWRHQSHTAKSAKAFLTVWPILGAFLTV